MLQLLLFTANAYLFVFLLISSRLLRSSYILVAFFLQFQFFIVVLFF